MKKIYLLGGLFFTVLFYSQSLVGGINSGSTSSETLIHTVGEIYVIPTNPDHQNTGTPGILYQTVLNVLGVNEVIAEQEKVSVYPNPTANYITLNVSSRIKPREVMIYDMSGKLISQKEIKENRIDLSFLTQGIYMLIFKDSELKPVKVIKK
ncbi:T9SS type A sorting domain-containing protein [Chryseobacterium tructae]|uniref:T9SS type A sorting domain-containing protein n=1 Tax=Chryseobacterium tructae TaxID=1037380 RepID=A0ABV7XS02_9FLAO|nr:T9SS type A sorting domain-containing protein [Chryseobacterium tructae]MDN3695601.1 T9SS type A sorting domain-containing protein [Chryseobacterium tructae]